MSTTFTPTTTTTTTTTTGAPRTSTTHTSPGRTSPGRTSPGRTGTGRTSTAALQAVEAELCMLHAAIGTNRARMIALIGQVDATGTWAATGATSTADWLVKLLDLDAATAREQVRVARALRTLPILAAALADGGLSYAKARSATRVATPGNEADVLALAGRNTAAALPAALAAWQQGTDPAAHRERQLLERSLTARTDPSGNRIITIVLPPEHAAIAEAVIDAQLHVMANPDATNAPAGASDGAKKTHPSLAQQRADAFVTLVDQLADPTPDYDTPENGVEDTPADGHQTVPASAPSAAPANATASAPGAASASAPGAASANAPAGAPSAAPPSATAPGDAPGAASANAPAGAPSAASANAPAGASSAAPESANAPAGASTPTHSYATNTKRTSRRARVELILHRRVGEDTQLDGSPLPEPSRRLLTCDADIRIMHHFPDGSPADLGRKTPVVSKTQRRLLEERAGGRCEHPGCTARHFLQAHHIKHWEDGGRTDLANLRLLCSLHHRMTHAHDLRAAVAEALAA